MRPGLFFVLGLLLGACAGPKSFASDPANAGGVSQSREDAAYDLQDKTVALVTQVHDGVATGRPRPFCTGTWVSDQDILTAFHCWEPALAAGYAYATHDDIFVPGEFQERANPVIRWFLPLDFDVEHDLALLRALPPLPSHRVARVAVDSVHAGSVVQTMGHSVGLWWSYSSGDVAAIRRKTFHEMDMLWIQTTAPISLGNSGGGLFDDRGFLVGSAFGYLTEGQSLSFFVHGMYAAALIRKQINQ